MEEIKRKQYLYYINAAITLFFMFGGQFFPTFSSVTTLGMKALGIFIGLLWGWCTCGMIWPSLMGLVAIGITGHMDMNSTFKIAFGDSTLIQLVCVLIFVSYLEQVGLNQIIARWFMSREFVEGKPWLLTLMAMLSAAVLSLISNGTAGVLMAWGLWYPVLKTCGMDKNDKFTTVSLFAILFACMTCAIAVPYQGMTIIYINALINAGIEVNYLSFTVTRILIALGAILLFWLVCRYVIRPDVSKFNLDRDFFAEMRGDKLNNNQKIAIAAAIIFLFALFVPNILPKTWWITRTCKSLGLTGVASIVISILSLTHFIQNGKSKAILDFNQIAQKLNWNLILLMAVTAPISVLLESEEAGIFTLFLNVFEPLTKTLGTWGFVAVIVLFVGTITQLTHNAIIERVLTPMILILASTIGLNEIAVVMVIMLPIQMAIITPAASANGALIWGNTEWTQTKWVIALAVLSYLFVMVYSIATLPLMLMIYG